MSFPTRNMFAVTLLALFCTACGGASSSGTSGGSSSSGVSSSSSSSSSSSGSSSSGGSSSGAAVVTVLYSFGAGSTDGTTPQGDLVAGGDGSFYGVTGGGGSHGQGTFYRMSPSGVEAVLYSFGADAEDSIGPLSVILGSDGNFYGTTLESNASISGGTVFKITPSGVETLVYRFGANSTDGVLPGPSLLQAGDGNLYGVTNGGGKYGEGTVFRLTPGGRETVLYSFGGGARGDGGFPFGGLVQGSDGNFYGVTNMGGAFAFGTVFRMTPTGQETLLYSFGATPSDSGRPNQRLTVGNDGNFYGIASGGAGSGGSVFRITPDGVETVLHSFGVGISDGAAPGPPLTLGFDGNLYGTTLYGGANNVGTVFRMTPDGDETVLYSFGPGVADATTPRGTLLQAADGSFYGITTNGGAHNTSGQSGSGEGPGTFYRLVP